MSNVPADLHYTKDHEWIKVAADGTAVIGITDHAQAALGDVTFVDLPKAGKTFGAGEVFGAVESVKAASDLYSPVSCEVLEVGGIRFGAGERAEHVGLRLPPDRGEDLVPGMGGMDFGEGHRPGWWAKSLAGQGFAAAQRIAA